MPLASRAFPRDQRTPPTLDTEILTDEASVFDAAARTASRYDFSVHPYFAWMEHPATRREGFLASQLPFRHAVEAFSQSLSAVLARTPRLELRMPILDNVHEEHGRGDLRASHRATFAEYLCALGANDDDLVGPCPVAVRAFNQALLGFCLVHSHEAGAALLGIIEHLYVGISSRIARTVHERDWCAPGSQRHYAFHAELDETHARDLLELAAPRWADGSGRSQIALGLGLGAHWFWALYTDLLPPEL